MSTPKKTTRKRHKNSHLGCATCKQRRIKCDEELPACRNCLRAKLKCAYLALGEAARNTLRNAQLAQKLKAETDAELDPKAILTQYADRLVLDNIQLAVTNTTLKSNKLRKITASKTGLEPRDNTYSVLPAPPMQHLALMPQLPQDPHPQQIAPQVTPRVSQPICHQMPLIPQVSQHMPQVALQQPLASPHNQMTHHQQHQFQFYAPYYPSFDQFQFSRPVFEAQNRPALVFELRPMLVEFRRRNDGLLYATHVDRLKLAFGNMGLFQTYIAYAASFVRETKLRLKALEIIQVESQQGLIRDLQKALALVDKPIRPLIITDAFSYVKSFGSVLIAIMLWHGTEHVLLFRMEYHMELTNIYCALLEDYSNRVYNMTYKMTSDYDFKPPSSVDNCNFLINLHFQVLFELFKYYHWPSYSPAFMQEVLEIVREFRKIAATGLHINQNNGNYSVDVFVRKNSAKLLSFLEAFVKYVNDVAALGRLFDFLSVKLGFLMLRGWFAIYPHLFVEASERNPYKLTLYALFALTSRALTAIFPSNYWTFLINFEGLYPTTMRDKRYYDLDIFSQITSINAQCTTDIPLQQHINGHLRRITEYCYKVTAFFNMRDQVLTKCLKKTDILRQFSDPMVTSEYSALSPLEKRTAMIQGQLPFPIRMAPKSPNFETVETHVERFYPLLRMETIISPGPDFTMDFAPEVMSTPENTPKTYPNTVFMTESKIGADELLNYMPEFRGTSGSGNYNLHLLIPEFWGFRVSRQARIQRQFFDVKFDFQLDRLEKDLCVLIDAI